MGRGHLGGGGGGRSQTCIGCCNLGFASEQETSSRLWGLSPKRLLAPSPIDWGDSPNSASYQAIRVTNKAVKINLRTGTRWKVPLRFCLLGD